MVAGYAWKSRRTAASFGDPSAERTAEKERARIAGDTFESVARAWLAKVSPSLAESTRTKHKAVLEGDVFAWIGSRR